MLLWGFLPVASKVRTCQVCCRITTLPGIAMHAMVAQIRCMVPLYTMIMSVVSVFRSSLTTILAQAPKQACITKGFRFGVGKMKQRSVQCLRSMEHHESPLKQISLQTLLDRPHNTDFGICRLLELQHCCRYY